MSPINFPLKRLWSVPVLLTLHNTEEAVTMKWFLNSDHAPFPERVVELIGEPHFSQFLLALSIVTVLPFLFYVLLFSTRAENTGKILLLLTQTVLFINVFTHVSGAVVAGGYVPGLISAIFINLPFSVFLGVIAARSGWLRPKAIFPMLLAGFVIHGPVLVALLRFSDVILGR